MLWKTVFQVKTEKHLQKQENLCNAHLEQYFAPKQSTCPSILLHKKNIFDFSMENGF